MLQKQSQSRSEPGLQFPYAHCVYRNKTLNWRSEMKNVAAALVDTLRLRAKEKEEVEEGGASIRESNKTPAVQ